jgi:hypothetical protein
MLVFPPKSPCMLLLLLLHISLLMMIMNMTYTYIIYVHITTSFRRKSSNCNIQTICKNWKKIFVLRVIEGDAIYPKWKYFVSLLIHSFHVLSIKSHQSKFFFISVILFMWIEIIEIKLQINTEFCFNLHSVNRGETFPKAHNNSIQNQVITQANALNLNCNRTDATLN